MTLIWPFKVNIGQTDSAIRFATHHFPLLFETFETVETFEKFET